MLKFENATLQHMFDTRTVLGPNDEIWPLRDNILVEYANVLYRTVRRYQPQHVLEIGFAYGVSTLSILTALRDNGSGGKLTTIDPNQADWDNVGLANVARAGLTDHHHFIGEPDYLALPVLLREQTPIDLAYIDGWHTFDYTLLDFFYIDKMLPVNGIVAFNDCGMRAVNKVIKFVRTHRAYTELGVGLKTNYHGHHPLITLARTLLRFSVQDRYFQKQAIEEPSWDFFAPF